MFISPIKNLGQSCLLSYLVHTIILTTSLYLTDHGCVFLYRRLTVLGRYKPILVVNWLFCPSLFFLTLQVYYTLLFCWQMKCFFINYCFKKSHTITISGGDWDSPLPGISGIQSVQSVWKWMIAVPPFWFVMVVVIYVVVVLGPHFPRLTMMQVIDYICNHLATKSRYLTVFDGSD